MKPQIANVAQAGPPKAEALVQAHRQSGVIASQPIPYDARFRRLLSKQDWEGLPQAVQKRFSKRIEGARVVVYPGEIRAVRASLIGRCFVQVCRLVGAPLPLGRDVGVPAAVSVSEDHTGGGQCWTRVYGRRKGFPQMIHSAKRFAGATGLEEHIGFGIGMALQVHAVDGGLEFRSDHYFLQWGGARLQLPAWLQPGETIVRHIDQGERDGQGSFAFSLELKHPWLGELIYQEGVFRDA